MQHFANAISVRPGERLAAFERQPYSHGYAYLIADRLTKRHVVLCSTLPKAHAFLKREYKVELPTGESASAKSWTHATNRIPTCGARADRADALSYMSSACTHTRKSRQTDRVFFCMRSLISSTRCSPVGMLRALTVEWSCSVERRRSLSIVTVFRSIVAC